MRGLMQDRPLLISSQLRYAADYHGEREIVGRMIDGSIHRTNWAEVHGRAQRLAKALTALGVEPGDRVGTIAWNNHRHLEIYFAVPGMGAVCHTINPRLFGEQIVYIANHAEDKYIFLDTTFVPLVEAIAGQLTSVKGYVIMAAESDMPETTLPNVMCYETLLAAQEPGYDWPQFDEYTASSLCYTSGTTGNPKGVLYAHRSTVLHSACVCSMDGLGVGSGETILAIVPMFHANCWGTPYAAASCGAKMVFPGPHMDGASVHELIEREQVTLTLGVPTVWLGLIGYLRETGKRLDTVKRAVIGGTAVPRSMMEILQEEYGVQVVHAWGMTETSPLGTTGLLKANAAGLDKEARYRLQLKQGRAIFGVDLKIVDDEGNELPRDGVAFGNLMVRGPWIASGYFKGEGGDMMDGDGFFPTGDVSTLDPEGYMEITDRAKDVIKSGGEWISSIDLENTAMGHPGVAEAAVIGVHHPKWDERPLLIVVREKGSEASGAEILDYLTGKIAKWWMPDDVIFTEELPHTATGKVLKTKLRQDYANYVLPTARKAG